MILDSKHITYEVTDITEPGKEPDKEFMQQNSNAKDAKHPLPPQIFNDESYCGVCVPHHSICINIGYTINIDRTQSCVNLYVYMVVNGSSRRVLRRRFLPWRVLIYSCMYCQLPIFHDD